MDLKIYPSILDGDYVVASSEKDLCLTLTAAVLSNNSTRILVRPLITDSVLSLIEYFIDSGADIIRETDDCFFIKRGVLNLKEYSGKYVELLSPIISDKENKKEFSFDNNDGFYSVAGAMLYCAVKGGSVTAKDEETLIKIKKIEYVLSNFNVKFEVSKSVFSAKAQEFVSPVICGAYGDWDVGAALILTNVLGNTVRVLGLNEDEPNSQKSIKKLLPAFSHAGTKLSLKSAFTVAPLLAVAACYTEGNTLLKDLNALSFFQKGVLDAVVKGLNEMGAEAFFNEDGLNFNETKGLIGGTVNGNDNSQVVLSLLCAATCAKSITVIKNVDAFIKDYPDVIEKLIELGLTAQII